MDEGRFAVLRGKLMERLEKYREIQDEEIYRHIDELILENDTGYHIRLADRTALRRELFNSVRRLDILQELVDDNSVNRKVFMNLLKQTKMKIDEAGGGREALSMISE